MSFRTAVALPPEPGEVLVLWSGPSSAVEDVLRPFMPRVQVTTRRVLIRPSALASWRGWPLDEVELSSPEPGVLVGPWERPLRGVRGAEELVGALRAAHGLAEADIDLAAPGDGDLLAWYGRIRWVEGDDRAGRESPALAVLTAAGAWAFPIVQSERDVLPAERVAWLLRRVPDHDARARALDALAERTEGDAIRIGWQAVRWRRDGGALAWSTRYSRVELPDLPDGPFAPIGEAWARIPGAGPRPDHPADVDLADRVRATAGHGRWDRFAAAGAWRVIGGDPPFVRDALYDAARAALDDARDGEPSAWRDAFLFALAARRHDVATSVSALPCAETPPWLHAWTAAFRTAWTGGDDLGGALRRALELAEPGEAPFEAVEELEMLLRLVTGDADGFCDAVHRALDRHADQARADDPRTWLALGPLALVHWGLERGLDARRDDPFLAHIPPWGPAQAGS